MKNRYLLTLRQDHAPDDADRHTLAEISGKAIRDFELELGKLGLLFNSWEVDILQKFPHLGAVAVGCDKYTFEVLLTMHSVTGGCSD